MTEQQQSFCRIFYWSAYVGSMELMNLFMVDLHFSPFMSLYNNQDTVHACIIAENDSMLRYIVTNSNLKRG